MQNAPASFSAGVKLSGLVTSPATTCSRSAETPAGTPQDSRLVEPRPFHGCMHIVSPPPSAAGRNSLATSKGALLHAQLLPSTANIQCRNAIIPPCCLLHGCMKRVMSPTCCCGHILECVCILGGVTHHCSDRSVCGCKECFHAFQASRPASAQDDVHCHCLKT